MDTLQRLLTEIDGRGYKAYKQIQGEYRYADFKLSIDHVQGDPFADPSRCRIKVENSRLNLSSDFYSKKIRRTATEDFIGRRFASAIVQHVKGKRGSGKSGQITIATYGQQVLERNAVLLSEVGVEVRFQLALPANGRKVNAHQAQAMLFDELPRLVAASLLSLSQVMTDLQQFVDTVDDQQFLRDQLQSSGLVAFIADGSLLPRLSGIDDLPLPNGVSFLSPKTQRVQLERQHGSAIEGLGVFKGVTLIVGGGFHGKSTLLNALELGVYNHIPGDGRERVVIDSAAFKIRAEDGRAVTGVDISPFINDLPQAKSTAHFNTQNASGSTSQVANIMEALATGSRTLLIDEDTSATNFMIRDERMQALVSREKEPITPLVQRIRGLYQDQGISMVMVMGGSGDFFSSADHVIMLDNYRVRDVTREAKALAIDPPSDGREMYPVPLSPVRVVQARSLDPLDRQQRVKIQSYGVGSLRYGLEEIDMARIEQLVDSGQLRAIGYLMADGQQRLVHEPKDLVITLRRVLERVQSEGLDRVTPYIMGTLAMPRLQELVAAVNRLRRLELVE